MKKSKRALSLVLCGAMLLGYFPAVSFAAEADGLCEHHTVHENCGYVAAVAGADCTHEHDDSCFTTKCAHVHGDCGYVAAVEGADCNHQHDGTCGYAKAVAEVPCTCQQEVHTGDCAYAPAIPERKCTHIHGECSIVEAKSEVPCGHDCSLDEACGEKVLNCTHVHDESCGYVAAVEGKACEFVCEACAAEEASAAAVAEVKALMDALPAVDVVQAMSMEDQKAAYEQTQAAYEAYSKLTADQQQELADPEEVFKPLFEYFNTLIDADGEIGSGTPDGTPPVILSITISTDKVTTTGSVTVVAEATDDISGVSSGSVVFYCEETGRTLHTFLQKSYYDSEKGETIEMPEGQFIGKLGVGEYLESGIFKLRSLSMSDIAGNSVSYFEDTIPAAFKALQFEVIESDTPDSTAPTITNLAISVTSVEAPGSATVVAEATDDISGVSSGSVVFYCEETGRTLHTFLQKSYYDSEKGETIEMPEGQFIGRLNVSEYLESGVFKLRSLSMSDIAGNSVSYFEDTIPAVFKSVQFEVIESDTPDSTAPSITNITISTTSVTAPGIVTVIAEATDDISGVSSGSAVFYCNETGRTLHTFLQESYYDSEKGETIEMPEGQFIGKLNVNQYLESGVFKLRSLSMSDIAGNSVSYFESTIPDAFKALQFEVVNTGADITTSTNQSNFVEEVTNAANDAYIAADYSGNATMPKAAFEAIAGTDKTIDLISAGITWRFEGSDITEEIKDIDLKVEIQKVEEDSSASGEAIEGSLNGNPGVVMKFPENGTLPGKATIQVKVDYAMREYLGSDTGLSVYYYNNQTGELELIASNLKVINDTYVEFPITHCSYYVLTNPNGSNSGSTSPGIAVDKTNFPDENFRTWILEQDYGKDGVLTQDELSAVTMMDVTNREILDLTGIEHFTALTILGCVDNKISVLDISKNTALNYLNCGGNLLTSLDVSNNTGLKYLSCHDNPITALDLQNNTAIMYLNVNGNALTKLEVGHLTRLEDLSCDRNRLTTLDVSKNTVLRVLNCGGNQLSVLDVSNQPVLEHLTCNGNQLKELDVSKNTKLDYLGCSLNQLTKLDVSKNTVLRVLHCMGNQLSVLDVSNQPVLEHLTCNGNQLTKLDISKTPKLDTVNCSENQLSSLNLSSNLLLTNLECGFNQLTCLDVSKNAVLKSLSCVKNQLTVLDVSSNTALCYLDCGSNKITSLDVSSNPKLLTLGFSGNQLTEIDVSKNTALEQINCSNNQLTSLDLSSNPKCSEVNATGNRRQIKLNSDNTFALSTLPGFDVNKASQWTGATVDNQTLTAKGKTITYSYQVDSGKSVKFTLQANNYDPNAGKMEGTWGNLTWKIDEAGTLTISGTGEMVHFRDGWEVPPIDGYPWHRHRDSITSVVVKEGVTSLAEIAFHGLKNLTSVTLPASLVTNGDAAFAFCTSLESITIPANVSTIGKEIFIGSTAFKQITFTGKAPSFDSAAFGEITAEAYYPCDNDTWTTEVQQDYGGDITWVGHVFGQWSTEGNTSSRTCTRCGYTEHKVVTDSGDVEIEIPEQPDLDVEVDPVLPTEENYILVEKALESTKYDVLKVFDITLKNSEGVHVQPNGTVKVKLPLDWEKDGNYKVYRVNTDKTLTDMNAYRQGSHMVFETDHFSIYVIAEERVVTAPTAKTLTYTGSAQALVNAGSVTGGTMQYSLDGVTYSASVPTATNAGTYTVYYKAEDSQAAAQTVSVTIAKAKVTITADNKVAAVGTAKPTLTYTVAGLKGSDKLSTNPTLACNATMSTAGDYEIVVSGGDAGVNYEIQRINGKLSVKNEHKVNVAAVTNGTVSVSHEKAIEGTEIAITATPKSGYHFSTLTVKDAAGTSYVVSTDNNGKYYFIMPDVDVTVTVSFSKNVTADPTNPKTGDGFAVVLWSGIMMTSLLCMAVIIPSRKKFR